MWLTHSFKDLVHYFHGEKHGGVPEDMVLEKEMRALHFSLQAAEGVCHTRPRLTTDENPNPSSTVTHIIQQSHTYPKRLELLIVELPMCQAFTHTSLYGPFLFKLSHIVTSRSVVPRKVYLTIFACVCIHICIYDGKD